MLFGGIKCKLHQLIYIELATELELSYIIYICIGR